MELFDSLLNSATGIFNFIQNIPNMLSQCLGGFPPALVGILLAGFLVIVGIRIIELIF